MVSTPFRYLSCFCFNSIWVLYPTVVIEPTPMTATESFVLGFHGRLPNNGCLPRWFLRASSYGLWWIKGLVRLQSALKWRYCQELYRPCVCFFIYGGLIYLGATSGVRMKKMHKSQLLHISHCIRTLGHNGGGGGYWLCVFDDWQLRLSRL